MSRPKRGEQEETKRQTRLGYARLFERRNSRAVVTFHPHTPESLAAYRARVAATPMRRKGGEW